MRDNLRAARRQRRGGARRLPSYVWEQGNETELAEAVKVSPAASAATEHRPSVITDSELYRQLAAR